MQEALTNPAHGYYTTRDEVFGQTGDFVTSPEISQMFGELIGIWCVSVWQQLGMPRRLRLVEMGPGTGVRARRADACPRRATTAPITAGSLFAHTLRPHSAPPFEPGVLMADVLRAAKQFRGFSECVSVTFVELKSPLRDRQRESVAAVAPETSVAWIEQIDELDADCPVIILAHEFFDAMPIHKSVLCGPRGPMTGLSEWWAVHSRLPVALAPALPSTRGRVPCNSTSRASERQSSTAHGASLGRGGTGSSGQWGTSPGGGGGGR